MTLIREAIIAEELPIKSSGLRRGHQETLRIYRRLLRPDHTPIIEEARQTGRITRTKSNERAIAELIESRALLLYRNDEEWYNAHPAIDGIDLPRSPAGNGDTGSEE